MPGQVGYMADQQGNPRTSGPARGERRAEKKNDGPGALERVTVNLNARAARALEFVTTLTGDSKTDAISRALQVYAFFEETTSAGGAVYIKESKDAELQRVKIF